MRRVLFATLGQEAFSVACFAKDLEEHGGKPENIKTVVCDMSPAYLCGIREKFLRTVIILDKLRL